MTTAVRAALLHVSPTPASCPLVGALAKVRRCPLQVVHDLASRTGGAQGKQRRQSE